MTGRLTAERTAALVERCRAEGTTVHGLICAVWLRALDEVAPRGRRVRSVSSPVDVRRLAQGDAALSAGVLITLVTTRLDLDSRPDVWDAARQVRRSLCRALDGDGIHRQLLRGITVFGAAARTGVLPPARYDFSITNLGRVDLPGGVQALYGPLVNVVPGERTVGVVTVAGRLHLSLTTFADDHDAAWSRRLLERAVHGIGDALDQP